jgi:hypothetical protein
MESLEVPSSILIFGFSTNWWHPNGEGVPCAQEHDRSSLNISGREGLNQLMPDMEKKVANFSALLVYDVSRLGDGCKT